VAQLGFDFEEGTATKYVTYWSWNQTYCKVNARSLIIAGTEAVLVRSLLDKMSILGQIIE